MKILLNTNHINGDQRHLNRVLEILQAKGWHVAAGEAEIWPLSMEDRQLFEWHLEEAAQQARDELALSTIESSQVHIKQALVQMRKARLENSFLL